MKFTESIKVQNKIFRKEDFLKLWECVSSNTKGELSGTATIKIQNEGREVTAEGLEIFETNNFKTQKIKSIHIDYRSSNWNSQINILIENSQSYLLGWSKITIEGSDENWVLLHHKKLNDILNEVENSSMLIRFYMRFGRWLSYAILAFLFGCGFSAIAHLIKTITDNIPFRFVLLIAYFCFGALGFRLLNKIEDLFYVVEIDVNGLRSRLRNKIATAIWAVLSAMVIPVLISWYFGISVLKVESSGATKNSEPQCQPTQHGEGK